MTVVAPGQSIAVTGTSDIGAVANQTAVVELWVEDTQQPGYVNYGLGVFPVILARTPGLRWMWSFQVQIPPDIPTMELGNIFRFHCVLGVRPSSVFADGSFVLATSVAGGENPPAGPASTNGQDRPLGPLWPPPAGHPAAVYVWHESVAPYTWHVRITALARKAPTTFSGVVSLWPTAASSFTMLNPFRLETGQDWYGVTRSRDQVHPSVVNFSFLDHGHLDGLDFEISPGATAVTFAFSNVTPTDIFLGRSQVHPAATTFTITF